MNTPELDKLSKVKEDSQKIGEFLEWLQSTKHYVIASYGDNEFTNESLSPIFHGSHGLIEELLAEYFKINLKKVDQEKEAIYQQVAKEARAKK